MWSTNVKFLFTFFRHLQFEQSMAIEGHHLATVEFIEVEFHQKFVEMRLMASIFHFFKN